jgi:ubiquitin C
LFADCDIQKESILHLVLRLRHSIEIIVNTLTGKMITLDVEQADTIERESVDQLRLIFT